MRLKLLQRFRKARRRDPWQFAVDAGAVMSMRISRGMSGRLTAEEARRMVAEKQAAAIEAQCAYLRCLLQGNPRGAHAAVFDIYDRAVHANRRRLARRRLWPFG